LLSVTRHITGAAVWANLHLFWLSLVPFVTRWMGGSRYMRADQTRGCRDQISVVACLRTVRQQRDVFQPSADPMPSGECTSIDCPTRYAVPVVNLLQRDARGRHDVFHLGSVPHSSVGSGVKRLDKDAATPARQSGTHESSRIFNAQQSSLDTDASGYQ